MDLVMAASAKSSSPHRIKVKKEVCTESDNIKDFAETAMNDILGWYGYGDSVDRIDIGSSSSSCIGTAAATSAIGPPANESVCQSAGNNRDNSSPNAGKSTVKLKHNKAQQQHKPRQFNMLQHNSCELSDTIASTASGVMSPSLGKTVSSGSSSNANGGSGAGGVGSKNAASNDNETNRSSNARNCVNLHHHGESSTSEKDSSRESSKSPTLVKMLDKQETICQWCRRGVPPNQTGILGTTEGTIFCSESCFSQSRRASFKRAKTCDWCRHVRHAVSYVDFQDGVTQLQFCSDKCLNQYKMQIFCNETKAHLDMNPHLKEKAASTGSLITPELWLKNCRSRSVSPSSDRSDSISPAPSLPLRRSPGPLSMQQAPATKKPLISVAPASKLLSKSLQSSAIRSIAKSTRKRRSGLRQLQQSVIQSRRCSNSKVDFTPSNNNNNSNVLNNNLATNSSHPAMSKPATVTSSVQDLRTGISIQNMTPPKFENRDSPTTPRTPLNIPSPFLQLPFNAGMRPPFLPTFNPAFRFGAPSTQASMPPPPPLNNPLPNIDSQNRQHPPLLGFPAPPVTVLVPYPIIIPLPLPIPIPIPLIDFLKASNLKSDAEPPKTEPATRQSPAPSVDHLTASPNIQQEHTEVPEQEPLDELDEESPLDFTVTSHDLRIQRDERDSSSARNNDRVTSATGSSYSLEPVPQCGTNETSFGEEGASPEHKLPKFRITRLNMRRVEVLGDEGDEGCSAKAGRNLEQRSALQPADEDKSREMVERSRPLRKRKRLVVQQEEPQNAENVVESASANG
ncbi:sine oculis-binding protein homolog B [Toxorhynchites rutilus septentrionalis]|uniref:sine oculis-binding protein homolog B n=1 Tax=Toxorhynchites rutilus septentrionalis TaxID=329112 RepID=UPI00247A9F15|nr:sine oculis-binding protein homolog B [Toxorhynchites rutilus septentrionalis]